MIPRSIRLLQLILLCPFPFAIHAQNADQRLRDKTLVAWVSPATLEQAGGSVLTIDNGDGTFDGIVYGEVMPGRWMPGSENFARTEKNQVAWPAESAADGQFLHLAIVYRGREISMYRDGVPYAEYTVAGDPPTFGRHATVLFGRRHVDAADADRTFAGRIKEARIYDRPLDRATIAAMKPGTISAGAKPWAWWSFGDEGLREKTGRFNQIKLLGDVRLEGGSLLLPGKGATVITVSTPSAASGPVIWSPVPFDSSLDAPVPRDVIRTTRLLRERLLADPYRPIYHFCVPEDFGVPGDPNGAFYANGRYHLMYLYNRTGAGFCWGHVSSSDLVHWRHHPDAIGPGGGDEGCFSGGGFVDDDGTAYLAYWMLWGARGIGIARSEDRQYDRWRKLEANPVIRSTKWGVTEMRGSDGDTVIYGSADPSNIWRHDGQYYMLTGNLLVLNKFGRSQDSPPEQQGDRLYLFRSNDLKNWFYMRVFYERNPRWTEPGEDNMCPSFLPLPSAPEGGPPSGKHLLLFISHNRGCQYYVGSYTGNTFLPENHGRMTWVDNTYFAPEALVDEKGRQIMWAWLTDNPPGEEHRGWSGVYGLPRTLWLGEDGTLRMRPVPELESLRHDERTWQDIALDKGRAFELSGVTGDACELQIDITPSRTARSGVKVRSSPDGKEETLIYYDPVARELVFDATRSGPVGRTVVERAPLDLKPDERLNLRLFVDRAVVEVYANDRQAIARRVYPEGAESQRIALFADGEGTKFVQVKAWSMAPANPF